MGTTSFTTPPGPCLLTFRAPIADLIKTPSRTATAKKTRGATTAQKTRQEQIRLFNAQLSPLAAKSPDVVSLIKSVTPAEVRA